MIKSIKKVVWGLAGSLLIAAPALAATITVQETNGAAVEINGAYPVTAVYMANDPSNGGGNQKPGYLLNANPNFASYAGINWPTLNAGLLTANVTTGLGTKTTHIGCYFEVPAGSLTVTSKASVNPGLNVIVQDTNSDYFQSNPSLVGGTPSKFDSSGGGTGWDRYQLDLAPTAANFAFTGGGSGGAMQTLNKLAIVWTGFTGNNGVISNLWIATPFITVTGGAAPGNYQPATYNTLGADTLFNFELSSGNGGT